jgi:hypothetical protein
MDDNAPSQARLATAIISLAVALVVLAGVGLVYVLVNSPPSTPPPALVPTPTLTPTSTTEIITSTGVLRRIESTMILQTTIFRIDTVVRAKKEGSWFFNWGGQNILLFVKGTVTAGVDLGELSINNIEVSQEDKEIIITLPRAKVLNATLDSYEIEDYRGGPPDQVDPKLLQEGLEAGRQQIATTACVDEILKHATADAKRAYEQIVGFVDLMDYKVTVNTAPVGECSINVVEKGIGQ